MTNKIRLGKVQVLISVQFCAIGAQRRQSMTKQGTPGYIIKIRIIGAASLVLLSLGIVLSVFHFNNEDIIGFRDLIQQNKTVPGKVLAESRLPILHRQIADQRLLLSERNCTVVAEVPSRCRADFRKLVQLNFRLSSIRRKPDLTDMPKVNPLNLNYFMSATIVMSFGLVFGIISLTWLKLSWEKKSRAAKKVQAA